MLPETMEAAAFAQFVGKALAAPVKWADAHGPVSYTHLDVYKRQILHQRLTNLLLFIRQSGSLNGLFIRNTQYIVG